MYNKATSTTSPIGSQWPTMPTMLLRGSPRVFRTWLLVFAAVVQADEAIGPNQATHDASRRQASGAIQLCLLI